MSRPSLVNILRNTLSQVEENIESGENQPAVSELRKRIALTVAEVELAKDKRSAVDEREPPLLLVTRRPRRLAENDSAAPKERRREDTQSG